MIHISTIIHAPLHTVWNCYTEPQHIMQWNQASPDWHCPAASNDLRVGGRLSATMAAKDGSFQFEFGGIYDVIVPHNSIHYHLDDGRRVLVQFKSTGDTVEVTTDFDPESENPLEMQKAGWQAILDSFGRYTETVVNRES